MARDTIIAERPVPPKGRLSFPMLILRMIANPVASWGEDFYEEPAVLYGWLGLQTLYVMDPVLIQRILLDDAENYSKQPLKAWPSDPRLSPRPRRRRRLWSPHQPSR